MTVNMPRNTCVYTHNEHQDLYCTMYSSNAEGCNLRKMSIMLVDCLVAAVIVTALCSDSVQVMAVINAKRWLRSFEVASHFVRP